MITTETDHRFPRTADTGNGLIKTRKGIARDILRDAFDDQAQLMSAGRFDDFKGKTGKDFLVSFVKDPFFMDILQVAGHEASVQIDDREFKMDLRGFLFEAMSYLYLSSLDQSVVPVMRQTATEVEAAMSPNVEVRVDSFGQIGLMGHTVFDGFVVDSQNQEPYVTGFIESTLSVNWRSNPRKVNQIASAPYTARNLGKTIAAECPSVLIVTPISGIENPRKEVISGQLVENIEVPVTQDMVMQDFMPFVYRDAKNGKGKSLEDLRDEWRRGPIGRNVKIGEPSLFRR